MTTDEEIERPVRAEGLSHRPANHQATLRLRACYGMSGY
jgi:hypothetical protein